MMRRIMIIGVIFLCGIGVSAFASPTAQAQTSRPVIVISPGHGWLIGNQVDPGAVVNGIIEKDLNLDVAKQTRELLARCPVDVYLTREGDDSKHTLNDVDEIVNARKPTVAISIHANSLNGSGTEGWYTLGGNNDKESERLARLMTEQIASRLSLKILRVVDETQNQHKGLYIHWWNAPSALIELAVLQQDSALLLNRKRDFARALAYSLLTFIRVPVECADAIEQPLPTLSAYFPNEQHSNPITLVNDGLVTWRASDYRLVNVRNPLGAPTSFGVPQDTPPGKSATWNIPATAPTSPGIHQQVWQLQRNGKAVGPEYVVTLVVVPEGARELKTNLERQIADWKQRGEQELNKFIQDLGRQIAEALAEEAKKQLIQCFPSYLVGVIMLGGGAFWRKRRTLIG